MAIKPICDNCKNELVTFGALLFSPPSKNNKVKKFHLCAACYRGLEKFMKKKKKR